MREEPISTRPLNDNEKLMRQKFYESLTAQSDLMDKLGERLLTLELTIPGLYATALKLIAGETATVQINPALYLTFGLWALALILTLLALTPKKWVVDPDILKQDLKAHPQVLGIEDFFEQSAAYKRRRLIASSFLFFAGIFCVLLTWSKP